MGIALLMFYIGVFTSKENSSLDSGVMSAKIMKLNLQARYDSGESWVSVFGVFFPAGTTPYSSDSI